MSDQLAIQDDHSEAKTPAPTLANVAYGTHERQVLDFWHPAGNDVVPLLFYIHGGGWLTGEKTTMQLRVDDFLQQGIAVVSTNYRYLPQTILHPGVKRPSAPTPHYVANNQPPVAIPLHDIARALQFVRSKAGDWRIDPAKVAAAGSSAGGCSALWLAFHADLADPQSTDPVARQSTAVCAAAGHKPQTSLDPAEINAWVPNNRYGGHAFGFAWNPEDPDEENRQFLGARDAIQGWIREYSPLALLTEAAPPVYLRYPDTVPELGQPQSDTAHTANLGVRLYEAMSVKGLECEFVYQGKTSVRYPSMEQFLISKLTEN